MRAVRYLRSGRRQVASTAAPREAPGTSSDQTRAPDIASYDITAASDFTRLLMSGAIASSCSGRGSEVGDMNDPPSGMVACARWTRGREVTPNGGGRGGPAAAAGSDLPAQPGELRD